MKLVLNYLTMPKKILSKSNVLVDQLYSYGQGMNALSALAMGRIVLTGAEPENYELLNEYENRPIVNVIPDKYQITEQIERIIESKNNVEE